MPVSSKPKARRITLYIGGYREGDPEWFDLPEGRDPMDVIRSYLARAWGIAELTPTWSLDPKLQAFTMRWTDRHGVAKTDRLDVAGL